MNRRPWPAILITAAVLGAPLALAAPAHAAPAPEVEYLYDVTVRRHYNFPGSTDALGYGHGICEKVTAGESYAQVMGDVRSDVTPNDEFAANYLVSYAVNLLCPEQIWRLRNSAAQGVPPAGEQTQKPPHARRVGGFCVCSRYERRSAVAARTSRQPVHICLMMSAAGGRSSIRPAT